MGLESHIRASLSKGIAVRSTTCVWNGGGRGRSGQRGVGQHQPKKAGEELEFELVVMKWVFNSRAGWCFTQTHSEIQLQKGECCN